MDGLRARDIEDLDDDNGGDGEKTERKPSRRRRESSRSTGGSKRGADGELRTRLETCFERIAGALAERGDEELAEIVREDAGVMSAGLASLTRPFKPVRAVVLVLVAVVEPVLAFGRILRVLAERWAERRARILSEREAAAEAAAAEAAAEPLA